MSYFQKLKRAINRRSAPAELEVLEVDGRLIEVVRRPYRKTMTLSIHPTGRARVVTSRSMPQKMIHGFVAEHAEWIGKKLMEFEKLRAQHPPKSFREGELYLFMGEPSELILVPAQSMVRVSYHQGHLVCWYPANGPRPGAREIREALLLYYEKEGRRVLRERVEYWSSQMGLRPSGVSFRSQKSRWGSCSSRGRISLNWKLIAAPFDVLDYVVVHELSHLAHRNHSPKFWGLVRQFVSDLEAKKAWLRHHHYDLDFLSKTSDLHLLHTR